jgi:hypothetical protein
VKKELKLIKTAPQNVTFIFNLFYGSEKDFYIAHAASLSASPLALSVAI